MKNYFIGISLAEHPVSRNGVTDTNNPLRAAGPWRWAFFASAHSPPPKLTLVPHRRPQFFFRTADVTGTCLLPKDVEMVVPGDNATMEIELIYPVAMAEGLRFALREGGKTVGAGVVAKLIE